MRVFTHIQAEVFENRISKNNFQRSECPKYVSNMSHLIKIIILHDPYSHLEAYISLWSDLKKSPHPPPKKIPIAVNLIDIVSNIIYYIVWIVRWVYIE